MPYGNNDSLMSTSIFDLGGIMEPLVKLRIDQSRYRMTSAQLDAQDELLPDVIRLQSESAKAQLKSIDIDKIKEAKKNLTDIAAKADDDELKTRLDKYVKGYNQMLIDTVFESCPLPDKYLQ